MDPIDNPLGLPITWRTDVPPPHQAEDGHKLADLVGAIRTGGWRGAPIVADGTTAAAGQDRAYTGAHRITAMGLIAEDEGVENAVPCVWIEDLCVACAVDWETAVAAAVSTDDPHLAALTTIVERLPRSVADAYGLDTLTDRSN
jgi:hypothetical protein